MQSDAGLPLLSAGKKNNTVITASVPSGCREEVARAEYVRYVGATHLSPGFPSP